MPDGSGSLGGDMGGSGGDWDLAEDVVVEGLAERLTALEGRLTALSSSLQTKVSTLATKEHVAQVEAGLLAKLQGLATTAQLGEFVSKSDLTAQVQSLATVDALKMHVAEVRQMAAMALFRTLHGEVAAAQSDCVNLLLVAKRQITGSGAAGLMMTSLEVMCVIAAAACTFGGAAVAAAAVGAGAAILSPLRNSDALGTVTTATSQGLSIASAVKQAGKDAQAERTADRLEGQRWASGSDLASLVRPKEDTPLDHAKTANEATQAVGVAVYNSIRALQKMHEQAKDWWEYDKLENQPLGVGAYTLTKKKRRDTAFIHHGEGGSYCIEHDFSVAVGLAYRKFLEDVNANKSSAKALIDLAFAEQKEKPFESPSFLTRYVLREAVAKYDQDFYDGAFAKAMLNRGNKVIGYDGSVAAAKVKRAVSFLNQKGFDADYSLKDDLDGPISSI